MLPSGCRLRSPQLLPLALGLYPKQDDTGEQLCGVHLARRRTVGGGRARAGGALGVLGWRVACRPLIPLALSGVQLSRLRAPIQGDSELPRPITARRHLFNRRCAFHVSQNLYLSDRTV